MKKLLLLFTIAVLLGCNSTTPSNSTTSATQSKQPEEVTKPTEPEEISNFRGIAKKRHLHFSIWCNEEAGGFTGFAWPDSLDWNPNYYEEGGVPAWMVDGATQEGVARKLAKTVKMPPNWFPSHKKAPIKG